MAIIANMLWRSVTFLIRYYKKIIGLAPGFLKNSYKKFNLTPIDVSFRMLSSDNF